MKRGKRLERRAGLQADPEKTRAWQDRSRARARERAGASEPRRPMRAKTFRLPEGVRAAAANRSRGACVVCLHRAGVDVELVSIGRLQMLMRRGTVGRAVQMHHVLPKQTWPHLAKVAENVVGVCPTCHMDHEGVAGHAEPRRIPRAALPACVLELAEREGLGWYIERTYPA